MGHDAALTVDVEQRFASGFVAAPSLSATIAPGGVLVLFGPSGSGKTTMLRQIAGLERPDRGMVSFAGETWCDTGRGTWAPPQQRGVGLVFQHPALFPHLSVRENVRYGLATSQQRSEPPPDAKSLRTHAAEIAARLGVDEIERRYPRELSGGEGQRVALARALATRPRLLLLDEPFAALDAPTRTRLRQVLRAELRRTGTPAVLVTHDRTEALAIGDAVAVVLEGRVRQLGAVADVFSRPVDAAVAASLGVEAVLPAKIAAVDNGLLTVAIGRASIHVAERDLLPVGAEVYACIRAEDVTLELSSPAHASARNHLEARVVSIASEGPIDRVALDCGFALDALVTRRSREELNLAPGMVITAAVKATSVHLVPRG